MEDLIKNPDNSLKEILRSSSEISMIATDPDGLIIVFSRGAEDLLGYSADDVVNVQSALIFHDRNEIIERGKYLTNKLGYNVEGFRVLAEKADRDGLETRNWKYIKKDQSSLNVFLTVSVLKDSSETVTGYLIIAISVGSSRYGLEYQDLSEEIFIKVFNLNPSIVSLTTIDEGRFIDVNEAFLRRTGYSRDEVIGKTSDDIAIWALKSDWEKFVNELVMNKRVTDFETSFRMKNGEIRNSLISSELIRLRGKLYIFSFTQDFTDHKRIEEALKESEEKFARAFNANPNVISITSMDDGRFMEVNEAYLKKTGYTREEVIGHTSFELGTWADYSDRERYVEEIKKNKGRVRNLEVRLRLKNGDVRDSLITTEMIELKGKRYFFNYTVDITDRKHAEEALRRSEEKYRIVFEKSATANAIFAEDTTIMLVNSNFERLFGYSREEVEGRMSWTAFVLEEHLEMMKAFNLMRRTNPDSVPQTYEFKGKTRGGGIRNFFISVALIPGTTESIANLIDITERKQAEEALSESEKKLSVVFDNTPNAITISGVDDDIIISANKGIEITGWLPEDIIGKRIDSLLNLENSSIWSNFKRIIKESGKLSDQQIEIIRKDGIIASLLMSSVIIKIDEKPFILTILTDISRLRESEEKFMKVFMSAPYCIAITRLSDGMILDANMAIEKILGWKREEFIGSKSMDPDRNFWVVPEDRDWMVADLKSGREIIQREFLFRGRDSVSRSGVYSASSISIAGESCIIFILQDVSEQRRLEDDRRKLEEHLYHSQKMDAIGQLASGVAHDFNNILTGIQGNISLMMMEYDSKHPHFRRFHQIEEQVKRGANLTRQLLGFARGGKYEVKTISINDLIRKTSQFFIETRKDIESRLELNENVYSIEADAGQIEQVLINLFINAGHAMPRGGSLIIESKNITLKESEAISFNIHPGEYVKVSVTDTGIGMDRDTLMRIFEPFFTTKSDKGGTGLGLASAYGIMRNHGGAIHAYSEPGQGSVFALYFPLSNKSITVEKGNGDMGILQGTGTILIIDDESLILDTASELLVKLGYKVFKAASGQEGVDIYREMKSSIDLVILDMIMPGMSGSQALNLLKELNPGIKVILSSGYGFQGEVRKVMESGCVAFIQKPFIFSDLSAVVHRALYND